MMILGLMAVAWTRGGGVPGKSFGHPRYGAYFGKDRRGIPASNISQTDVQYWILGIAQMGFPHLSF
jgi:hypothetical protein